MTSGGGYDITRHHDHSWQNETSSRLQLTETSQGFGQFLVDLKSFLTRARVRTLATAFHFKPADIDEIEVSEDPGHVFINLLREKDIISPSDISDLISTLKACDLHGVANDVTTSFRRYQIVNKLKTTRPNPFEEQTSWNTGPAHSEESLEDFTSTFQFLSDNLGRDWIMLARCLDISEGEIERIRADNLPNQREMIYIMLFRWGQKNGSKATLSVLHTALRRVGRLDLSEQLKLLNLRMTSSASLLKEENSNYKRLKNDISTLPTDDGKKLAEFFSMSSKMDAILSSEQPARKLLYFLEEKAIIDPSNISRLEQAFSALDINAPCYNKIVNYQRHVMEISSYDRLIADLSLHITPKIRDLCKYFNFTDETTTRIIASPDSGLSLLMELDTKSVISATDVGALTDPFKKCQLVQAAAKIQEYQSKLTKEDDVLETAPNLTMKDSRRLLFIQYLKKKMRYWYETMTPVPWKRSCKWRSTDLYVGNWLIFKDSQTISSHIDKKCKLKYREMFSHARLTTAERIIVEGEPGCGKTMLTAQLAYDWSEGLIRDVDILVLLPLKFVGNRSLLESIKEFYIPSQAPLDENDIEEILSSTTDTIGVLLDGLEEYNYHGSSEVAKVFKENKHPNWKVVLTSRSNCATDLPTFPRLQIDGFGEEERNKYIENLFKDDEDMQMKTKTAISDSAFVGDLCTVPLLFVLAVHSMEDDRSLEKDDYEKAGTFVRSMISKLTAEYDVQTEIDGPNINQSTNTMSYLGEFAFNGLKSHQQQLGWQRNFLEDNVGNCKQWIDSGILVIEEEFATITKDEKQNEGVNVKVEDTVPPIYVADGDTGNQSSSKDASLESSTSTADTGKHVPQMVKFLHKVIQEWFAAAYFSTMLKNCTNRDEYYEYVSAQLPYINPTDLHYLLRFTCFLHPPFCHTIIDHLLRSHRLPNETIPSYIMDCICLCFAEHGGIKDSSIKEAVTNVCADDIVIHSRDSPFLQRAKYKLLEYASQSMITIENVRLIDVVADVKDNVMILDSGLEMYVLETAKMVEVSRWDQKLTEDHFQTLLEFLATGTGVKEIICEFPDPPPILTEKIKAKLLATKTTVKWIIGGIVHLYDRTKETWELKTRQEMTSRERENEKSKSDMGSETSMASSEEISLPQTSFLKAQNERVAEVSLDFGQHQIRQVIDPEDATYSDNQFFFQGGSKSLEASSTISQEGGSIEIPETGVALQIQPNSFQREDEVQTITVRILQRRLYDEPASCFEDHTSVMVEILPNKFQLQRPAKLTLPHCLVIRNLETCQVQIFQSHHEREQTPQWENITKSVRWELLETSCTIWIRNFCWIKYVIGGEEIYGKILYVYTLGEKVTSDSNKVTALVGYFPALPGNDKELPDVDFSNSVKGTVYKSKLPKMIQGDLQQIVFCKEPRNPLEISILEIIPVDGWEASPGSARPKEISYQDIEMSIEKSRPFTFQRKTSDGSFPTVHFKVHQGNASPTEVHVNMEKGVIKEESSAPSVDSLRALVGLEDQCVGRVAPVCSNIEVGHTVSMISNRNGSESLQVRQLRQPVDTQEIGHLQSQVETWYPLVSSVASFPQTDSQETLTILEEFTQNEMVQLARCLNRRDPLGNDWKRLADELHYRYREIMTFETEVSPTEAVIRDACCSGKLTSKSQLEEILKDMDRKDAALVLTCKAKAAESFGEKNT